MDFHLNAHELDSQSYGNKLPQSGWLKTAKIYSLAVLEAQSPKSACQHGRAPSESQGRILPCLPLASGGGHQPLGASPVAQW